MSPLGLCVTPDFYPTQTEQTELNPPYYRSILYKLDDIYTLLNLGRPLIITINNQCEEVGGDWSGWNDAIFRFCITIQEQSAQDQILFLGCGNEFDIYWHNSNKVDVPPEFAADIARRASRICRQFGIKVAPTSVAGPEWVNYLTTLADLVRDDVDYFDIHPYGQRPNGWYDGRHWMHGDLEDVIQQVKDIGQKPVVCSEYGVKIKDAGSEYEVAEFLYAASDCQQSLDIAYMSWFAYSDLVGAPNERGGDAFGLKSDTDVQRPAWFAYQDVHEGTEMPPDNNLDEWNDKVGKGLLDMMKADNTTPTMASEWRPFDRPQGTPATIEQCIGLNNVTYCWNLNTGSGWRIRPS